MRSCGALQRIGLRSEQEALPKDSKGFLRCQNVNPAAFGQCFVKVLNRVNPTPRHAHGPSHDAVVPAVVAVAIALALTVVAPTASARRPTAATRPAAASTDAGSNEERSWRREAHREDEDKDRATRTTMVVGSSRSRGAAARTFSRANHERSLEDRDRTRRSSSWQAPSSC